jgi:catechol 2,3-dioxygenase-like lactoylglutathione lyase family enzyme
MLKITGGFPGFSVNDIQKAKEFYGQTLGIEAIEDAMMGSLNITLPNGVKLFVYPKENHEPATYTVLNFMVPNIDEAVDELVNRGISFEKYDGFNQDEKGIARTEDPTKGPNIAWFKDPAGNILSLIEGSGI